MIYENEYLAWQRETIARQCVENLRKNQFDAHFAEDGKAARNLVLSMAENYRTFGVGGSDTIRALGLVEALESNGKIVYDHWRKSLTREAELEIRLKQGRSDCFLCSANAVSVTGEIINVDGVGNRTSAMSFGPRKVMIVAGTNKVSPDLASAFKRIREIAAPMRARSLGMSTPCAQTGVCIDCHSPQRICRVTTVLHRKPMLTDVTVILANERLGY